MHPSAAGLLCALLCHSVLAQPAPTPAPKGPVRIEMAPTRFPPETAPRKIDRPSFAGRIVSLYDFEEPQNPEEVPHNWFRAQDFPPTRSRAGFPPWNNAAFDRKSGHSGTSSVMLPTKGGSTSLRLSGGLLQIFPDAEYRVSAWVRTDGLQHAAAVMEVSLLDDAGAPVPGGVIRSRPLQPENWTEAAVTLHGPFNGARSMRVDLLLLQPDQLTATRPGERYLPAQQDFSGTAWFDDVSIVQLPRVRLTTGAPANIFISPDKPVLTAQVRDLTGEELKAELVITDIDDNIVDRQPVMLARGGSELKVTPNLPRYGWYRVQMNLSEVSGLSANATNLASTTLLYLGPTIIPGRTDQPTPGNKPFALMSDKLPPEALPRLNEIVELIGVGRATAPAPLREATSALDPVKAVTDMLDRGTSQPVDLTLSIPTLPLTLADRLRLSPQEVLTMGTLDSNEWVPALTDLMGKYAPRIGNWQIGSIGDPKYTDDARMLAALTGLRSGLHRLSPNPRLVLPWRADVQWLAPPRKPRPFGAVTMLYPSSFRTEAITATLSTLAPLQEEGVDTTWVVETLASKDYGKHAALNDFLQRAILLWSGTQPATGTQNRPKIGLLDPWFIEESGERRILPRALLGGLSTLAHQTEGRRVVGELPSAPHVRALIVAPENGAPAIGSLGIGSGGLIAWCDAGDDQTAEIRGYFGGGVLTTIDAFGNRSTIPPDNNSGRHTLTVGATPVFIEGIDAHLVQFLADIRLTPAFVPAVIATHDCELIIHNPWLTRITGDIQLLPPEQPTTGGTPTVRHDRDWSFAPSAPMPFSIAPGQTTRLPFSFIFAAAEEAGPKQINLMVRLSADRSYPAMRIAKTINVGLEDLDLQVSATLGPRQDGPNVIVTTTVVNSGRLTRTLQVSAHAPGYATQSQPIVDLGPGETALRRFVLPNGAEALASRRIRVLMVDVDGSERLTKFATVPN